MFCNVYMKNHFMTFVFKNAEDETIAVVCYLRTRGVMSVEMNHARVSSANFAWLQMWARFDNVREEAEHVVRSYCLACDKQGAHIHEQLGLLVYATDITDYSFYSIF